MLVHRFYEMPEARQVLFIWLAGILAFVICAAVALSAYAYGLFYLYLIIPLPLILAAPFVDAPLGKRQGKLVYYSPLFITEKEFKDEILIHGGTLFDYVYTLDSKMKGPDRTRLILHSYLQGLLNLIEAHENTRHNNLVVRGTTYIINERTANRFGLHVVKTDFNQVLILLINYLPLTLAYSFARAKLSFPGLGKIRTFEATIADLINHKPALFALEKMLSNSLNRID